MSKYSPNFCLVWSFLTIMFMFCCGGDCSLSFCCRVGSKLISHKPLVKLRCPLSTSLYCLKTLRSLLSNSVTQPSLHRRPMEIRGVFVKPLKTCAVCDFSDKIDASGRSPLLSAWICALFGNFTIPSQILQHLKWLLSTSSSMSLYLCNL